MNKLLVKILCSILIFGCSQPRSLNTDDFNFLIYKTNAISHFDEDNMHRYKEHFNRAKKLESYGLIKVTRESGKTYIGKETTKLGDIVINKINDNIETEEGIPIDILSSIGTAKESIDKEYGLTLPEFLLLKHRSHASLSAPSDDVFNKYQTEIEIVKSLSIKGYLEYAISDSTFNGEPSKSFRWSLTEKGRKLKVKLSESPS